MTGVPFFYGVAPASILMEPVARSRRREARTTHLVLHTWSFTQQKKRPASGTLLSLNPQIELGVQTSFEFTELFRHLSREFVAKFSEVLFGVFNRCQEGFGIDIQQFSPIFSRDIQAVER